MGEEGERRKRGKRGERREEEGERRDEEGNRGEERRKGERERREVGEESPRSLFFFSKNHLLPLLSSPFPLPHFPLGQDPNSNNNCHKL